MTKANINMNIHKLKLHSSNSDIIPSLILISISTQIYSFFHKEILVRDIVFRQPSLLSSCSVVQELLVNISLKCTPYESIFYQTFVY